MRHSDPHLRYSHGPRGIKNRHSPQSEFNTQVLATVLFLLTGVGVRQTLVAHRVADVSSARLAVSAGLRVHVCLHQVAMDVLP